MWDLHEYIRPISHYGGAVLKNVVCLILCLVALAESGFAQPQVKKLTVSGDTLLIRGADFGKRCRSCEVVASFDGLRYSLNIIDWNDSEIRARLVDLGRGIKPTIQPVLPGWQSRSVRVKVNQKLLPQRRVKRMVKDNSGNNTIHFSRQYDSNLGGKGEEVFEVVQSPPACGKTAPIIDSAEILLGPRTRFGEAKITRMPRPDCQRCEITVAYYWEPTGRLAFQLHVYRRIVEGVCQAQVR